jgi:hypothetical protein
MGAILPFLDTVLSLVPLAIQAGENVAELVERGKAVIATNADPTDADWQVLHDLEAKLSAKIDAAAAAAV